MTILQQAFISDQAGLSIADFLKQETQLSKAKIKECMQKGGVWLRRGEDEPLRLRKASDLIKLNDEVHIYYDSDYLKITSPKITPYEIGDNAKPDAYPTLSPGLKLWNKPADIIETISLFSDHLNFDRVLELSIPEELDCHHLFPVIAYCEGPFIIAHTIRAASELEQLINNSQIALKISLSCDAESHSQLCSFIEEFNQDKSLPIILETLEKPEQSDSSRSYQHRQQICNSKLSLQASTENINFLDELFIHLAEEYEDNSSTTEDDSPSIERFFSASITSLTL